MPSVPYCQAEYSTVNQHLGMNGSHLLDRLDTAIRALEFYADERNYRSSPEPGGRTPIGDYQVFEDYGARAREALGVSKRQP